MSSSLGNIWQARNFYGTFSFVQRMRKCSSTSLTTHAEQHRDQTTTRKWCKCRNSSIKTQRSPSCELLSLKGCFPTDPDKPSVALLALSPSALALAGWDPPQTRFPSIFLELPSSPVSCFVSSIFSSFSTLVVVA